MPALTTRYLPPTNTRPGRIVVTTGSGKRRTLAWDHALSIDDNHREAARVVAVSDLSVHARIAHSVNIPGHDGEVLHVVETTAQQWAA